MTVPFGSFAKFDDSYIPQFDEEFNLMHTIRPTLNFENVVAFKHLNMYMDIAERIAQESHCVKRKVGAVVVTQNRGLYAGYNGTAAGTNNTCEWVPEDNTDNEIGTTKPTVIHAEENAFNKMLNEGISSKGSVLFITCSPCLPCAMKILGSGVITVIFRDFKACSVGIEYLVNVGNIKVYQLKKNDTYSELIDVSDQTTYRVRT